MGVMTYSKGWVIRNECDTEEIKIQIMLVSKEVTCIT